MEEQRVSILKTLEEKQTKAAKDADGHDSKLKSVNKILDQLKAGKNQLAFLPIRIRLPAKIPCDLYNL